MAQLAGFKYYKPSIFHMEDVASTSLYEDNSIIHRVASISHGLDGVSIRSFCDSEFDVEHNNEIFSVPIRLLDRTEICIECERNYSHVTYNRFDFGSADDNGEYKFFIKASLKVGDKRGFIVQETVVADSVEKARSLVEKSYEQANVYNYYYISRSVEYGEWEVLTDNR